LQKEAAKKFSEKNNRERKKGPGGKINDRKETYANAGNPVKRLSADQGGEKRGEKELLSPLQIGNLTCKRELSFVLNLELQRGGGARGHTEILIWRDEVRTHPWDQHHHHVNKTR